MSGQLSDFSRGPVQKLATILARYSVDPIEWEVLRYRRLMEPCGIFSDLRQDLESVAVQLGQLARMFNQDILAESTSSWTVQQLWREAAQERDISVPDLLLTLADLMRMAGEGSPPGYDEVPLGRWEAEERYPHLYKLTDFMYDYMYEFDNRDAELAWVVLTAVTRGHPEECDTEVPPITAQSLEALSLCKKHRNFRKRITQFLPMCADPKLLELIADTAFAHMKIHHRAKGRSSKSPVDRDVL